MYGKIKYICIVKSLRGRINDQRRVKRSVEQTHPLSPPRLVFESKKNTHTHKSRQTTLAGILPNLSLRLPLNFDFDFSRQKDTVHPPLSLFPHLSHPLPLFLPPLPPFYPPLAPSCSPLSPPLPQHYPHPTLLIPPLSPLFPPTPLLLRPRMLPERIPSRIIPQRRGRFGRRRGRGVGHGAGFEARWRERMG